MNTLPDPRASDARWRKFMLRLFGFIVLVSGLAFFYKLWEFFQDLSSAEGLRFAGAHLLTYCLVAGGFLLLLTYGFLRGHFADIEQPKYDLMLREENHDRQTGGRP